MWYLRERLALLGGALIVASGAVSIWVGGRAGFMVYEPDPAGIFGHVGVWAGVVAIVIGSVLIWMSRHEPVNAKSKITVGLLTVVLGHMGAAAGALLVGTAGLLLCYVAGFWLLARGARESKREKGSS